MVMIAAFLTLLALPAGAITLSAFIAAHQGMWADKIGNYD